MPNDMMDYAVALSVISAPGQNGIWDYYSQYDPATIYKSVGDKQGLEIQSHISQVYSGSPLEVASAIRNACKRGGYGILTYWDHQYPRLLREIARPPLVLYYRGNDTSILDGNTIAMVGTRKSDSRSTAIAKRIAGDLVESGFTVVSGMAVGIDRASHCGALEGGGTTIGVLAHGIDRRYPYSNRDLYDRMAETPGSLLVSEYPPGINAVNWTFARRNRLISGMSMGTVIVKAAAKSGALITGRYACEQNREVFACPGMAYDDEYEGCVRLIQNGAIPVFNTADILENLPSFSMRRMKPVNKQAVQTSEVSNTPSPIQVAYEGVPGRMIGILEKGDMEIDDLVRHLQLPSSEVNEALVMLELSNVIRRDGNMVGMA